MIINPLTLNQLLGDGATQTATTVTLLKADLGLPSSPDTKAESILAAIFKKAIPTFQGNLTDQAGQPLTDQFGRLISFDNSRSFPAVGLSAYPVIRSQGRVLHSFELYLYAPDQ